MAQADEETLDDLRLRLAPEIALSAVFDGWSDDALLAAAKAQGVDPALARLAFPGGAMDMIEAWVGSVDARMEARFGNGALDNVKIRDRIRDLVWFRLEQVMGLEEAFSRALAIQAMPQNVARALKMGWASADRMWRLAGDTATDYNHYTKRAILASIYAATLAVFVNDESEGKADSRAFLDRRIEGVMKFEKAKAKWLGGEREHFDVARFLGRLRYPSS
ncbi:COQ9 family protein [Alteraurantiacibacter aquimixticola]|uniref:COQ9 family protein n=1 Tax=Alteraurantiacibacter aquimixticola TaxID=2489173 RepID=A0A4T3EZT2_9SPHN|nr:COQ9 family protein [Alteraurantiacibacter aquimixticola]TIX49654.1 COQ9 family protein [Alteraurantiacibacter aquimixticola]